MSSCSAGAIAGYTSEKLVSIVCSEVTLVNVNDLAAPTEFPSTITSEMKYPESGVIVND